MDTLQGLAKINIIQIIVFGCFCVGIFYFTLYDDGSYLKKDIKNIQTQAEAVQANINKTQSELEHVKTFQKEIEVQKETVKAFLNFIPNSLTFTDISTLVIKQAKVSGINIESKQDSDFQIVEGTNYETLNMKIQLSGSFSQLMFFLSNLTEQKRILIVNQIKVQVSSENKMISADINLLSYRYNQQKETNEQNNENPNQ